VFVGEKDDVEILPTNDMAAANLQLLQEAKNEIDLLGPNAALAGKNETDMSGRAILAQQQGGLLEAATFLDCVRAVAGRLSLGVVPGPALDRGALDQGHGQRANIGSSGSTSPSHMLQHAAQQMGVTQDNFRAVRAGAAGRRQLRALAQDPQAQQVVQIENNVAELDVDILVDEGIDTPTVAAEQFDQMLKMAGTGMVQIPGRRAD
jgi:hypothetical protein